MLHSVTAPEALIAVASAGNIPYFSRRRAIDILGRAIRSSRGWLLSAAFLPGHNKWNLDHSIRDGGPDLILGLPRHPARWITWFALVIAPIPAGASRGPTAPA
jgi:hypothetical protein